jgi:hypothetical protein
MRAGAPASGFLDIVDSEFRDDNALRRPKGLPRLATWRRQWRELKLQTRKQRQIYSSISPFWLARSLGRPRNKQTTANRSRFLVECSPAEGTIAAFDFA